jgi:outer membrane protein assembly factor BamB
MQAFGKYEILEELGRGGFATVYRARDTKMEREVALKVITGTFATEKSYVQRFQQEERIAANLRHPNIVPVYDFGEVDSAFYIAMALIGEGRTLRDLLDEQAPLTLAEALPLLTPLAAALDYLHHQDPSLVHRDVKPSNVLLEATDGSHWIVLTDFGLVRSLQASTELTQSGSILGTPAYLAPEQADPKQWGEITTLVDIYALGVVAYEMFTGRPPFKGATPAVLHSHAYESPPPPQELQSDLGEDLSTVLLQALRKPPAERYPSAGAFIAALQKVADTRSKEAQQDATLHQLETQAQEFLEAGEWLEALDRCTQMVRLDPDRPAALRMLTTAKLGLDQERAEVVNRRRLAKRYDEGLESSAAEQWESAVNAFEFVAEYDPNFRDVQERLDQVRDEVRYIQWYEEGVSHANAGRWDEACRIWIDLLRERPNYRDGEAISQLLDTADALLNYQGAVKVSSQQQQKNAKRIREALTLYDDLAAAMDGEDWEEAVRLGKRLSTIMFAELNWDLDHLQIWLSRAQSELQKQTIPWTVDLNNQIFGQMLVVKDYLLLNVLLKDDPSMQRSELLALGLTAGRTRWSKHLRYAIVSGLAADPNGLTLVSTVSTDLLRGDAALLALGESGDERWRWQPGVQRISAPALVDNKVWITVDSSTLVIIDAVTGSEISRTDLDVSPSSSAPTVKNDIAYVPCRGPHLIAIDSDGHIRWRFDYEDKAMPWLEEPPVIIGDILFAALSNGIMLAISIDDGSLVWSSNVGPKNKPSSPIATDGKRLYIGVRDGLRAIFPGNGDELWSISTERRIEAAPIVVGDVVYAACHDHYLYALDAETGRNLWQYQVEQRIEVSPALATCGDSRAPCAIIADRGGKLTAVARPLSAAEHESAGNWREAVSYYLELGKSTQAAKLYERLGEISEAAKLWIQLDRYERAADLFESIGDWQRAAKLWRDMGRPFREAEALEGYAKSLEDTNCSLEERANAWRTAAEAFQFEGEMERETVCRKEIARCLHQPIIALNIEHAGLVLNAWSQLKLAVKNEGYGSANNLKIHAIGEQFEGQVTNVYRIKKLRKGRRRVKTLDARPLQHGERVPLHLIIEYSNMDGEIRTYEQTVYVTVASLESNRGAGQVLNIDTTGGTAIIGDVDIRDGDFIGRDKASDTKST